MTLQSSAVALTFVVGTASDAFKSDIAETVAGELRSRYSFEAEAVDEPYESEPVHPAGWRDLQNLMRSMVDNRSQLAQVEAYQAVFIPASVRGVDHGPARLLAAPRAGRASATLFAAGALLLAVLIGSGSI